jgi:signal transduction histidine kinase
MNADYYVDLALIGSTAGTLLSLFLVVLIVGYRRRRTFERVLFFFTLALFLYYAGFLLILNARLYYPNRQPQTTDVLASVLVGIALAFLPALLVHVHIAYGWAQVALQRRAWQAFFIAAVYLPGLRFAASALRISGEAPFDFPVSERSYQARNYFVWLVSALAICAAFNLFFARRERGKARRALHNFLALYFAAFGWLVIEILLFNTTVGGHRGWLVVSPDLLTSPRLMGLVFAWLFPIAILVYAIVRCRSFGIGAQKNLVYSVSVAFLAILYLGVVRRLSGWLDPFLPPEATASILLFVLVVFFEPLQRGANRLLRRRFQEQVDRLQHLSSDLQREALRGEFTPFLDFAEKRVRQEFGLEEVRIQLNGFDSATDESITEHARPRVNPRPAWFGQPVRLALGKKGAEIGELVALPIGSAISGETMAALEFLAEQLPSTIELCRVIHQKIELERELDERERMALIGQMAASISHNLKNPLGSMKTVLQVQLENPDLTLDARRDLTMVLGELDRLSAKLNQLLKYARPAVRPGAAPLLVTAGLVAEQVVSLLRHEAERRRGQLMLNDESAGASVGCSEEALADILSNLVVNAIEAMPEGGAVSVGLVRDSAQIAITVTDDGPGVTAENRVSLFRPFFTTKPSGTGLGLAIVERRASESGGTVICESPVVNGRGARFTVRLPIAEVGSDPSDRKRE